MSEKFKITRELSFNEDKSIMYQSFRFYIKGELVRHLRKEYSGTDVITEALYFIGLYGKITPEKPFREDFPENKRAFSSQAADLLKNHNFVEIPLSR